MKSLIIVLLCFYSVFKADARNVVKLQVHDKSHWKSYQTLDEIYDFLETITQTHPDIVSLQTIGTSIEGRPIQLVKISNGNANNTAIWVDGGIHAREWVSPAAVTYIIHQIVYNFNNSIFQNIDWYIVPVINPDGYLYTHTKKRMWRKNRKIIDDECAGVDLNRNFGYKWAESGVSSDPCSPIYPGKGPFTEPESIALRDFIQGGKGINWKAYITFHSSGQYVLYPWGYAKELPPDHEDLSRLARKIVNALKEEQNVSYVEGPTAETLYPAAGGSDDWAKAEADIKYAYTIELRDEGQHGFDLPADLIEPTAQDALLIVKIIAEAVISDQL